MAKIALSVEKDWSRREFMQTLAAAGLGMGGLVLVGYSTSAGAKERATLTIMDVGGSWGDSINRLIAKPFAKKHSLELAYDHRPNAQQIAAIRAMRGNPSVDTVEVGGTHMANAILLGLVDPIDPKKVPNYTHIFPAFKNKYWAARSMAPFVLAFNKTKVSKNEAKAKGWHLLVDPKLKGRVAIPKFGWMGEMWLNAVNLSMGGSYANMSPVVSFARKIIHNNEGRVMQSNDDGMNMFTSGEIWAAPFWTGRTYQLADKGIPLDFVYPEGWSAYTFGFVIVKGTPHKDLVEGFIDYSLSPSVQLAVAKRFSYIPTLDNIKIPDNLPRLKINPADAKKAAKLDYTKAVEYSDKNLQHWNQDILG